MSHRTLFPPPDENRALEQLERLHREILRARRDRERAGAEFDGFVQDMRDRPQESTPVAPAERAARRAPRAIVPSADRPATVEASAETATAEDRPVVAVRATDSTGATLMKSADARESAEAIPALAAPRRSIPWGFVAAVGGVLLGAAAAFLLWPPSPQPTIEQPPAAATTAQPAPSSSPAASPQPSATTQARPAAAAPVSPSTVQLTTDRTVWMRVTVDGEKVLEREVPPGQHLTYTPASTIVIRAGDAGAVRVKVGNGPEQVLGRDAFPVTRRFAVSQR